VLVAMLSSPHAAFAASLSEGRREQPSSGNEVHAMRVGEVAKVVHVVRPDHMNPSPTTFEC
jgi:hypothetical protein